MEVIILKLKDFKEFVSKLNNHHKKRLYFEKTDNSIGIIKQQILGKPNGYYGTGLFEIGRKTILKGKIKDENNL